MAVDTSRVAPLSVGSRAKRDTQAPETPSALDRKSRSTQIIVWLAFLCVVIWGAVWVQHRMQPKAVAEASWSIESPGILALDGKPTVDLSSDSLGPFAKLTTEKGVQLHRLDSTMGSGTRAFWRGSSLVLDNGEGDVIRIDPELELILPASAQYAWQD
jgi:hypothetical protein